MPSVTENLPAGSKGLMTPPWEVAEPPAVTIILSHAESAAAAAYRARRLLKHRGTVPVLVAESDAELS